MVKNNNLVFFIINMIGGFFILFLHMPIIGFIILISSGIVTFIFPNICFNLKNLSINEPTPLIRIGSLLILLCGISGLAYIIGIVPPIIFDYISKEFWYSTFMIFFFGGQATLSIMTPPNEAVDEFKYLRYDEELHIHSSVESIIGIVIGMCLFGSILFFYVVLTYKPMELPSYLLFFAGFLIVICPNAIDIKRIKFSKLLTRMCGIIFMIGAIISYILILENFSVIWALILFISSILMISFGLLIFTIMALSLDSKKILKELKKHGFI